MAASGFIMVYTIWRPDAPPTFKYVFLTRSKREIDNSLEHGL
jgi:hypothetical protein